MLKGLVIGNVVSTKKQESLTGSKFLEVRIIENNIETDKYIVAVDSVGAGIGFMLAMVIFSGVRSRLEGADIPKFLQGLPIVLIAASIVSLSFMGFTGLVDGIFG
jgi:electron transport complex protein RnfA